MPRRVGPSDEDLLAYIGERTVADGWAPSVRELCAHFGVRSSSTMHGYLARLRAGGQLESRPGSPRTLRVCATSPDRSLELLERWLQHPRGRARDELARETRSLLLYLGRTA